MLRSGWDGGKRISWVANGIAAFITAISFLKELIPFLQDLLKLVVADLKDCLLSVFLLGAVTICRHNHKCRMLPLL